MRPQSLPIQRVLTPGTTSLDQHPGEPFPESDHVLLCSFGVHLHGEQTIRQLRDALHTAGFLRRVTGHLVRISPVLRRSSRGRYQIRPFGC